MFILVVGTEALWDECHWISIWEDVTSGHMSYHMWRECWLEVEEHSDGGDLLQPFTAHLFTVLLILSVIVEAQVQCAHKLLRQCTQRPHQGLAEYDIPPQLEFCVCQRRVLYKYARLHMYSLCWEDRLLLFTYCLYHILSVNKWQ